MIALPPTLARFNRGVHLPVNEVLEPLNPERRASCQFDFNRFCLTYCSANYRDPSKFHIDIGSKLQQMGLSKYGVRKKALAAPRGVGKTSKLWMFSKWCMLYKHRKLIVFIGPNAKKAIERLDIIKLQFLQNPILHEDFPELTSWVRSFGGEGNRCPAPYTWTGAEFKLRNNVWIMGCGAEASIPGIIKDGLRPDMVVLDDLETLDVCRSETQTKTLEERIRKEILFLHGLGEHCTYINICTIRRSACIADRFTDPKVEPSWQGERYSALIKPPAREDLWDRFIQIFNGKDSYAGAPVAPAHVLNIPSDEYETFTPGQKLALQFYIENKEAMDAGAEVLDSLRMPLHKIYTVIAEEGLEAFLCEIQNQPPKEDKKANRGLTVEYLQARRQTNARRGQVPPWADLITVNIDVGMYRLHWQVDAWDSRTETSLLIDEGIEETGVNEGGRRERTDDRNVRRLMVAESIVDALGRLRLKFAGGYHRDGQMMMPLFGVDLGGQAEGAAWLDDVATFCAKAGADWHPMRGAPKWGENAIKAAERRNFYFDPDLGYWFCNSSEYKLALMRAYLQPELDAAGAPFPGARALFGETPTEYCKQMCSEIYIETFEPGKPSERAQVAKWVKMQFKNHWLDTAWNSRALMEIAREMKRIGVIQGTPQESAYVPGQETDADEGPAMGFGGGNEDPLQQ